jgi:O-methyltransferase
VSDSHSKIGAIGKPATLRTRLSSLLNKWLNRLGYTLVRFDGIRSPTALASHLDVVYAYEDVLITDGYAPWALDDAFLRVWKQAGEKTLVDIYRAYELYQLVRESRAIPGDVLEVGVWRGGTGAVLAAAANRWRPDAKIWLCDTFQGVVKTGQFDVSYRGGEHADATRADVDSLVSALALRNVAILEGVFPDDSGRLIAERRISFCHVDVDAYQSAVDVVRWVAARMERGGMLVFDDYGFSTCKGITRCVNELREAGDWLFIHNLNKHAILVRR